MSRLALLLVEDEQWVRDGVAKALRAAEPALAITPCSTVRAAITAIERGTFDAALIDLGLPDGSGTDVIVALRRRQPRCAPVAFTKFDDPETILGALRVGARGYLLKSAPTEQVVPALREAIAGGLPLSPAVASRVVELLLPTAAPLPTDTTLTTREAEVLRQLARGDTYAACARTLGIGVGTVQSHVKAIYTKLEVSSKAEAAIAAARLGLVP